jgi:PAS domain S-box-containing protein
MEHDMPKTIPRPCATPPPPRLSRQQPERRIAAADAEIPLRLSQILDSFPFYVMLVDEHHHILQANKAVRDQLGLEPEQILGQYCPRVIHGLDQPWYACPLEEAVPTNMPVEREALDEVSGRWMRSVIYPTGGISKDGGRIYFHMVSDITDRKQMEEQLKASREQLRNLSAHIESVREEERTEVAREIHDELGQVLTVLKIDLSWLNRRLTEDQTALQEKVAEMSSTIDTAIQTVKRISTELRPGALDDLGLSAAIEWQVAEFEKRTEIKVDFDSRPREIVLGRDLSTAVFRILQETLTNVARHASATSVKVKLARTAGSLLLTIRDNGKGIAKEQIASASSTGLIGMRERVLPWGGDIKITGSRGKGTIVAVTVPLDGREGENAEDTYC